MKFFDFLFRRAPTVDSEAPVVVLKGEIFVPSSAATLEITDEIEASSESMPSLPDTSAKTDLENIFCIIDYVDALGNKSRRRITMLSYVTTEKSHTIHAICHERKAFRAFRVDRIEEIVTFDGEVFAPVEFFTGLFGISFVATPSDFAAGQNKRQPLTLSTARDLREHLRAPLSILVCAAMSDGHVHIEEIDRIQSYAESEIYTLHKQGRLSVAPQVEVMDELCKMIAHMRPQRRSMKGYVERICEWPQDRVERLAKALGKVVSADGVIVGEEQTFVEEMNDFARSNTAERFGMLNATQADLFGEAP